MKFRVDRNANAEQPLLTQLMISHPNITGMQMDQVSRLVKPAHFVERMNVTFNDEPVLSARTDIAISADPNFRFYFVPRQKGVLKAEIIDNKGMSWTLTYELAP
jgi:sulfur-oxidizing protein SoxY